ncbi:tetratricopeptide repeat protein [Acinetobacter sp. 2JN-4]|uniref:tetratricopeptide repeat protein n=1 Tax=Acinetobacter sp. 2JN-4 TaxID=2479844 RepID=UPI000EFA2D6E|nr:tetratricopeptide repeat protein [Acinetobacter sp. 2JN-4]RLZ07238.1 tetratricopeptide repeat protein [Acinetobacter sp. 2JN-4]
MYIHQVTIIIMTSLYFSPAYAHPKHQHTHNNTKVTSTNYSKQLKNHQNDELRKQIVNLLLEKSYAQGDGELLVQAEDLIRASHNPLDIENRLLQTRIAQANHDFDEAEETLQHILKSNPKNSNAILQLANIYRLQGKFSDSLALCHQLNDKDVEWYQAGCVLQVDAMTSSFSNLKPKTDEILQSTIRLSKNDKQWMGNILLEIATRFNDQNLAQKSIPLLSVNNLPNTLAKSNWYISQKQYLSALNILKEYRYHDGALYRIILSKQKISDPSAQKDLNELTQRVEKLLKDKDHIHLREQAQYLWIAKKYNEGLKIAEQNWDMQRESEDFEVYAALAIDSNSKNSAEKLLNWSKKTGYRHPIYIQKLKAVLNQL